MVKTGTDIWPLAKETANSVLNCFEIVSFLIKCIPSSIYFRLSKMYAILKRSSLGPANTKWTVCEVITFNVLTHGIGHFRMPSCSNPSALWAPCPPSPPFPPPSCYCGHCNRGVPSARRSEAMAPESGLKPFNGGGLHETALLAHGLPMRPHRNPPSR